MATSADMFLESSYQWNYTHQKDLNRYYQGPKLSNVIDNAENFALMYKWGWKRKYEIKMWNNTNSKTNKISKRRESGKVRNFKV